MKKSALEMINELNDKYTTWERLIKDKRFELKEELHRNKINLQDTEASLGYQLGEGNTDKIKMLKQRKKTYQAEIADIEESMSALDKASGHTNFTSDFENIWKTSLEEYTEIQKEYLQKDIELEELEEQLNELQRKASAVRKRRTDLSYDVHSFDPIIKLSESISRIYKPDERVDIVEKQIYSRLHEDSKNFQEGWKLSSYNLPGKAIADIIHDVFGKIAAGELKSKPINWKRR